jgi:methylaspartate ammonia-lyase
MKITAVQAVPITGGWYCDDKAAFIAGEVQVDHYLARGRPRTPGFKEVREIGRGVGFILHLEGALTAFGDGTSVTYAGAAGRDPVFRLDERTAAIDEVIEPWLIGQNVSAFRPLADGVESLTWRGLPLHTALRYAITQALLEGAALALGCTKAEVLAQAYGLEIDDSPLRIGIQGGGDHYAAVDKAIYHRVDVFPHALIQDVARDLGPTGERLLDYARWIKARLTQHRVEEDYRPQIHFDCYGAIGRAYEHDVTRMADYLARLEETVSPFALLVESPVEMDSQAAQIELLGSLRECVAAKGGRLILIADEWCNSLDDVRLFAQAEAVDMIQVKMPDLGGITQSVGAVLECRRTGVKAYLGGSCNETDLNARNAVHLAVATGAEHVLARPGMGVDEGVCIMRNEEARLHAMIKSRRRTGRASSQKLQDDG